MSHAVDLPEDIDASESASEAYFKQKETEVDDCDEDPVEDICKHILVVLSQLNPLLDIKIVKKLM